MISINPKDPAFPSGDNQSWGLTTLEYLAAAALTGVMACPASYYNSEESQARAAVGAARATIDALNAEPHWDTPAEKLAAATPARPRRVYLAARYSLHPQMRIAAADLREIGIEVTSRWIEGTHSSCDEEDSATAAAKQWAADDLDDLLLADCCISFTESPGEAPGRNRGGRHVEFGVALATGKRVIVVGHRENVFHSLPAVDFYAVWAQALWALVAEGKRNA